MKLSLKLGMSSLRLYPLPYRLNRVRSSTVQRISEILRNATVINLQDVVIDVKWLYEPLDPPEFWALMNGCGQAMSALVAAVSAVAALRPYGGLGRLVKLPPD